MIYTIHFIIVLIAIYYLANDIYPFLNMESRISYVDEAFHVCSFVDFLETASAYITKSIFTAMRVVLIILIVAGIMFFKNMNIAIMLQVTAMGLSTVAGVAFLVLNENLGFASFVDNGWKFPFFIMLLVLGAILTIGGIVVLAKEKQLSIKKPMCVVCLLGMIAGIIMIFSYPYMTMKKVHKDNYDEIMYYAEIIDARRDGYDNLVEYNVEQYNIFDDHIYFIKNFKDYYELWRCDLDGENKTLIGTVTPKQTEYNNTENDGCVGLYVADGYVVIDFDDGADSINERYIMQLDDGTVMEIDTE